MDGQAKCAICGKRIGNEEMVALDDSSIAHCKCWYDPRPAVADWTKLYRVAERNNQ